jgi:hypothetical protein
MEFMRAAYLAVIKYVYPKYALVTAGDVIVYSRHQELSHHIAGDTR